MSRASHDQEEPTEDLASEDPATAEADELVAEELLLVAFEVYLGALERAAGLIDVHGCPPAPRGVDHPSPGEPVRLRDVLALSPLEVERVLSGEHPAAGAAVLAHKRAQAAYAIAGWGAYRRTEAGQLQATQRPQGETSGASAGGVVLTTATAPF
jgi:hypothetical protein